MSAVQELCADYELGYGCPILCDDAGYVVIFEARGRFFQWVPVAQDLSEILRPAGLKKILEVLGHRGYRGLKFKAL